MSVPTRMSDGKVTVPSLLQRKSLSPQDSTKITCLTAYDYPTARLLDEAGVEVLLVGDSLGMVMLGHETTLPVTVDEMLHHTRAVRKGTRRALVVADMPFGSYHAEISESVRNAVRFVKEAGAEAVKVEGGERRLELIARLTEAEIPVMGHVGLTPQSLHAMGGFRSKRSWRRSGESGGWRTPAGVDCAVDGIRNSGDGSRGIDAAVVARHGRLPIEKKLAPKR